MNKLFELFLLVSLFVMLIISTTFAAVNINVQGALLKTELAKYSPFPAEGGKFLTVWIKAENIGGEKASNATFTLEPEYPLTLINEKTRNYGSIAPGSDVLLEYRFAVDKNAPKGIAFMDFYYNADGKGKFVKKFNLTVENAKNLSDLDALFVEMGKASPGRTSTLTIDVANTASGTAYYTVVKADTPAGEIERNEVYVGNLGPDDFDSVDFNINVGNITPGTYPVNLLFRYKDKDDNAYTQNDVVFIKVLSSEEGDANKVQLSITDYAIYLITVIVLLKYVVLPLGKSVVKRMIPLGRRKK